MRTAAFAESQLGDLLGRITERGGQPKSSVQSESQFGQSGGPLRVPYVIDNQSHKLSDILNRILQEHVGRSLDSASAYFTVGGFGLLQRGLKVSATSARRDADDRGEPSACESLHAPAKRSRSRHRRCRDLAQE